MKNTQSAIEDYLGFYLTRPFWAISSIDISKGYPQNFTELMSEEIYVIDDTRFTLKICRDGRFLFRIHTINHTNPATASFHASLDIWTTYLKYVNAAALIFESSYLTIAKFAYFETRELTNKNCFAVHYNHGKYAGETIQEAEKFQRARDKNNPDHFYLLLGMRPIVSDQVLNNFSQAYKSIFDDTRLINLISELVKSISEFKIANFDTALVLSWFIIESIIQDKWADWIESKSIPAERINSKRKKNLNDRDYSISVKLNCLELNEALSLEFFQKINKVREKRNAVVHKEKENRSTLEDAALAINTANELLADHFKLNLHLNLSVSLTGFW